MSEKIQDIEEKGNRDKDQEEMENKIRQVRQMKKSDAILKFEMVMSSMCTNMM